MRFPVVLHRMLAVLSITAQLICFCCCTSPHASAAEAVGGAVLRRHRLEETDDAGEAYLQRLIFFGESTTAHLARSGGIMDTPWQRRQVWRDQSGTRMLDQRILGSTVDYITPTGETVSCPLREALLMEQPDYLVLSFGLNGIVGFAKAPERLLKSYRFLIEQIQQLSPQTGIILQSIYPIRSATAFSMDADHLNCAIRMLNERIAALADETDGVRFADTASILCDDTGALKVQYDNGDGIHLKDEAYQQILLYLRTHAWV